MVGRANVRTHALNAGHGFVLAPLRTGDATQRDELSTGRSRRPPDLIAREHHDPLGKDRPESALRAEWEYLDSKGYMLVKDGNG